MKEAHDILPKEIPVGEQWQWVVIDGKQKPTLHEVYATDGSGKLHGPAERYNAFGIMLERANYQNGQLDGTREQWKTVEGVQVPTSKSNWKAGKRDGESVTYYVGNSLPAGIVAEQKTYKDDELTESVSYSSDHSASLTKINDQEDSPIAQQIRQQAEGDRWVGGYRAVSDLDALSYLVKSAKANLNANIYIYGKIIITAADNAYSPLVALGLDPMARDNNGRTRLMTCLNNNYGNCSFEHVLELINSNDLKDVDAYGLSAISQFCKNSDRINGKYGKDKSLVLFHALLKGSDLKSTGHGGETALHFCIANAARNSDYAQELITAGADLNAKDIQGTYPAQMIFMSQYSALGGAQITWSAKSIEYAKTFSAKGAFNVDDAISPFGKSLREIVIENGDARSAMLIDTLFGSARS